MKQQIKIPEGWEEVELSNNKYFKIILGQSPPSNTYNRKKEGIPFYQGNADFGAINPIPRVFCNSPKKVAESGDILMSVRAPVGELNIANEKCCIGRGIVSIRALKETRQFLYYYLSLIKNKWVKEKTTFEGIKSEHIYKKKILLPPEKEQEAISKILSEVDLKLDNIERERRATERLRKGIMVKLLEKNYPFVIAGKYIDVLTGFAFSSKNFNTEKRGLPLIRIRDLDDKETECYYDGEYSKEYLVKKGDVLVGMDGEFNTYLWTGETALLNQRVCKLSPKDAKVLNKDFLFYSIQKPIKIVESKIGQTTVKHLSNKDFFKMEIPLPPPSEQEKIVSILLTLDKKLELEQKSKDKLEKIKRGLMNNLLTGNKRVNVENVLRIGGKR